MAETVAIGGGDDETGDVDAWSQACTAAVAEVPADRPHDVAVGRHGRLGAEDTAAAHVVNVQFGVGHRVAVVQFHE